jgi:ketosteroid isomerase-like protein
MKCWIGTVLVGALLTPELLQGPEAKQAPSEDPVHNELRALRDSMLDAFNKKDLDRLLTYVHKNAVVTWQDGNVSRGHRGIRDYYNRMMVGDKRIVESVNATAEVDELTILYGDKNGLAFGPLEQQFKLTDGMDFHLSNRWTANLVKEDNRWLVAGLHVSANIFDNPVQMIAVKRTALWTGAVAMPVGLLLGALGMFVIGRFRRR